MIFRGDVVYSGLLGFEVCDIGMGRRFRLSEYCLAAID
jgi:hypothetical protein